MSLLFVPTGTRFSLSLKEIKSNSFRSLSTISKVVTPFLVLAITLQVLFNGVDNSI